MNVRKGDTLRVNHLSEYPAGRCEYVCASDGKVTTSPRFTWYVFREAIVSGMENLDVSQVVAESVGSNVKPDAEFDCSNPLFCQIEKIWRQSQVDNMHAGVASDCPHRERLPYTGDGEVAMPMVLANFDAASFYNKWIGDVKGSQNPESGYVPNGAPWEPCCGGGPAWGAAICVMPWEFYNSYGDKTLLADCLQPMKDFVRYLRHLAGRGRRLVLPQAYASGRASLLVQPRRLGSGIRPASGRTRPHILLLVVRRHHIESGQGAWRRGGSRRLFRQGRRNP